MDKLMYETTASILAGVKLPEQTKTYKPVTHVELIDLTREALNKAGFSVEMEQYTMARDGKQANGRYRIKNVADNEMGLMIGWQNSYDKSLSLKFAIGTNVFICTNGCVRGDMGNFRRKHMGDVQIFTPAHIGEYVKDAGDMFRLIQTDRDKMKEIEMTKKTKSELLGRLFFEEAAINITQLGIIAKELEAPTHDYNSPNSMWELYNYATFALKESHPSNWIKQHTDVHKFFIENV